MTKTFPAVDNELHEKFKKAVAGVHGDWYGFLSKEHKTAIEDRIKVLEAKKK